MKEKQGLMLLTKLLRGFLLCPLPPAGQLREGRAGCLALGSTWLGVLQDRRWKHEPGWGQATGLGEIVCGQTYHVVATTWSPALVTDASDAPHLPGGQTNVQRQVGCPPIELSAECVGWDGSPSNSASPLPTQEDKPGKRSTMRSQLPTKIGTDRREKASFNQMNIMDMAQSSGFHALAHTSLSSTAKRRAGGNPDPSAPDRIC